MKNAEHLEVHTWDETNKQQTCLKQLTQYFQDLTFEKDLQKTDNKHKLSNQRKPPKNR